MTTAPAHNDAALIAAVQRILDDAPRTEAQMLSEQVATLTRQLADALQQRDAAAENARREAKRSDMLGERIAGARLALQSSMAPAEVIDFLDVAIDEHTPKPRVAVVMSPRFYTAAQLDEAVMALWQRSGTSAYDTETPLSVVIADIAQDLGLEQRG
jgi:hypothetical protein